MTVCLWNSGASHIISSSTKAEERQNESPQLPSASSATAIFRRSRLNNSTRPAPRHRLPEAWKNACAVSYSTGTQPSTQPTRPVILCQDIARGRSCGRSDASTDASTQPPDGIYDRTRCTARGASLIASVSCFIHSFLLGYRQMEGKEAGGAENLVSCRTTHATEWPLSKNEHTKTLKQCNGWHRLLPVRLAGRRGVGEEANKHVHHAYWYAVPYSSTQKRDLWFLHKQELPHTRTIIVDGTQILALADTLAGFAGNCVCSPKRSSRGAIMDWQQAE